MHYNGLLITWLRLGFFTWPLTLPLFWFCSSQLLNAMLPTSCASMLLLTMEIFGMKDFKDVRRLCNLSIVWGKKKKRHRMGGSVSNHYIWSFMVQQLKTFLPFPCPQPLTPAPTLPFAASSALPRCLSCHSASWILDKLSKIKRYWGVLLAGTI